MKGQQEERIKKKRIGDERPARRKDDKKKG